MNRNRIYQNVVSCFEIESNYIFNNNEKVSKNKLTTRRMKEFDEEKVKLIND